MKPLKLMMQAFGPYAGKEEIDFQKLGNRTMFVISGKTGSGKTTIFDGISFAIYGKASGEDRNGSDLRSQFAEDEMATEVSLEFLLRNKTYYIWRSPQQDKRKSRGDGFTSVGAKAELYIMNEDGTKKLLASNVREADEKIKEIVQLDANQFRQILMIPQGEFRKLLTSDSKDKELILQRLFHTELYKRIEDSLKEESSLLKKIVESKVNERSQQLKGIFDNENEEIKDTLSEENPNDVKLLPLLHAEINKMRKQLEEINEHYDETKIKRDEAKRKLDEAYVLIKQFEDRESLKKLKGNLESQQEEMKNRQKEIEDAYKAMKLEQQDLICHRLRKEYDEYHNELKEIEKRKEATTTKLEEVEKLYLSEEEKRNDREKAANEISNLMNIKEEINSLEDRQKNVNQLEISKNNVESELNDTRQRLIDCEGQLASKKAMIKQLEDVPKELFENEKEFIKLTDAKNKLIKVQMLLQEKINMEKTFSQRKQHYEKTMNRLNDLKSTVAILEEQWQMGQAGLLAGKLIDSNPCPVCGSVHHPSPAINNDQFPTEIELKSARKDIEKLEQERLVSESQWLDIKFSLSTHHSTLSEQIEEIVMIIPHFSIEDLSLWLTQNGEKQHHLTNVINKLKDDIDLVSKLEKEIERLDSWQKVERSKLEELQKQEKEISGLYIEKKAALEQIVKKIPDGIHSKEQYEAKLKGAMQIKQKMDEALENARNEWQTTKEQLSGLRASFDRLNELVNNIDVKLKAERDKFRMMLEENGFAGYQPFSQAKRSEKKIKQLELSLRAYREDYRSVSDRLNDMDERLKTSAPPELEELQNNFSAFEGQMVAFADEMTNMKMNILLNETIEKRVIDINYEIKSAEERFQLIGHLSDIARGQNTYRVTFERFVLAAFLDDILLVANTRLVKMTGGRYSLLRKTDRSKGNVQSGLELLVFDQYTGQERHVKTLSGGESFKAALALALGLADVVQQYAGGVSLETMFIDEGFGTLDPESLDHAIEALMDIQSSGRLVGIISHVPELKERIDARLEVIASQHGSHTEFHFMG
jgi:DNA repair protein SbcC/Rad50